MTEHLNGPIDLNEIEREARRMRSEAVAAFLSGVKRRIVAFFTGHATSGARHA